MREKFSGVAEELKRRPAINVYGICEGKQRGLATDETRINTDED